MCANVLTGCDTRLTRIVKAEAINELERVHKLSYRVKLIVTLILVASETTTYIRRYNGKEWNSILCVRFELWNRKVGRKGKKSTEKDAKTSDTPIIFRIISGKYQESPLSEMCMEVVTRSRSTPEFDVELFGCRKDILSKVLVPVTVPDNKTPAPPCVLKVISCSCLKPMWYK